MSQSAVAGARVSFSVSATGTAPLAFQWRKSGVSIPGATSSSLTLASAQPADAGSYTVAVSNAAGSATSAAATLSVHVGPVITSQPVSQTVVAAAALSLSVRATASPAPTYQWKKDGAVIAGATRETYGIVAALPADAGTYTVVVTNAAGSVTSGAATVTVLVPPRIVTAPASQTVAAGGKVEFTVAATGTANLRYHWTRNGAAVPGASTEKLTIASAQPQDEGTYAVLVTNAAGSVSSPGARLIVKYSRLVNLSTRGFVPSGGSLTPGFVVRGSGTKQLLVRGVGPALRTFGVEDALEAPTLQLAILGANISTSPEPAGEDTPGVAELSVKVGAVPLPAGSPDASASATLARGSYTVRIAPADATSSGIALAELYDGDDQSASTELANASTLGFVGTGERALMPGFVIRGNAPKRLLIRAIGPGLTGFGVADVLPNPQLAVIPLGAATAVAQNDDWSGAGVERAFVEAGAFLLEPGSRDAAVVVELPPGGYTVVVSGAAGTTGNALVEIYDLGP